MNRRQLPIIISSAIILLHACARGDSESSSDPITRSNGGTGARPAESGGREAAADDSFAGCAPGTIEADMNAAPLAGPGVHDGVLEPGEYIVSSTYLQLKQDALGHFQELLEPIETDLASREGVVALSFGGSAACGTARTLAVWRDEAAMFAFVTGEAHSAAVDAIGALSRGGSVVTHWSGDQSSATWPSAAAQLAADDGPTY